MTGLHVSLDAEQDRLDFHRGLIDSGLITDIALLRNDTAKGKASVAVLITLADGHTVLGETTWALLRTAFGALAASPVIAEEVIDP